MSLHKPNRNQLKENLLNLSNELSGSLELNTESRWVLDGIRQPEPFFQNLQLLLKPDSILYFEGCTIAADVSEFYASHKALNPAKIARDTILPIPKTFHVTFSPKVITELCRISLSRPTNELFDHMKAYAQSSLLISFHDAFENVCLLSDEIAEPAIVEFCARLGATFHKEPNINKKTADEFQRVLAALEQEHLIIVGEPWWKRLWRKLSS